MNREAVKDRVAAIIERKLLEALAEISGLLLQPVMQRWNNNPTHEPAEHYVREISGRGLFEFCTGVPPYTEGVKLTMGKDFFVSVETIHANRHTQV